MDICCISTGHEEVRSPAVFISFIGICILVESSALFAPLMVLVFAVSGALIGGKKPLHQVFLLFAAAFLVAFVVFFNLFFIRYIPLLLLACLYFSLLIMVDCILVYWVVQKSSYPLVLIFLYSILSRTLLGMSRVVFPFYWTVQIQLLPVMNSIMQGILPVCFEGISMVIAATVYLHLTKKLSKGMVLQGVVIIGISIMFSVQIKGESRREPHTTELPCALIQGGYSAQDYTFMETYAPLSQALIRRYLEHLEASPPARLIILPESAFPVRETSDGPLIQTIGTIARTRNAYIMVSMLLSEVTGVYNAVVLINPEGEVQEVYRKRNVMLFVESNDFTGGTDPVTFTVDSYTIAPLICFDGVFLGNYGGKHRPDVYMVTSNDVFAEGTVLSRLHQGYAVFNARMMGVPLVQVTQNGSSFYVDAQGRLTNLTRPYEQAIGVPIIIR